MLFFPPIFHILYIFHILAECFDNSSYFTILYSLFYSTSLQMKCPGPAASAWGLAFGTPGRALPVSQTTRGPWRLRSDDHQDHNGSIIHWPWRLWWLFTVLSCFAESDDLSEPWYHDPCDTIRIDPGYGQCKNPNWGFPSHLNFNLLNWPRC